MLQRSLSLGGLWILFGVALFWAERGLCRDSWYIRSDFDISWEEDGVVRGKDITGVKLVREEDVALRKPWHFGVTAVVGKYDAGTGVEVGGFVVPLGSGVVGVPEWRGGQGPYYVVDRLSSVRVASEMREYLSMVGVQEGGWGAAVSVCDSDALGRLSTEAIERMLGGEGRRGWKSGLKAWTLGLLGEKEENGAAACPWVGVMTRIDGDGEEYGDILGMGLHGKSFAMVALNTTHGRRRQEIVWEIGAEGTKLTEVQLPKSIFLVNQTIHRNSEPHSIRHSDVHLQLYVEQGGLHRRVRYSAAMYDVKHGDCAVVTTHYLSRESYFDVDELSGIARVSSAPKIWTYFHAEPFISVEQPSKVSPQHHITILQSLSHGPTEPSSSTPDMSAGIVVGMSQGHAHYFPSNHTILVDHLLPLHFRYQSSNCPSTPPLTALFNSILGQECYTHSHPPKTTVFLSCPDLNPILINTTYPQTPIQVPVPNIALQTIAVYTSALFNTLAALYILYLILNPKPKQE